MIVLATGVAGPQLTIPAGWVSAALLGPAGSLILATALTLPVMLQLPLPGLSRGGKLLRGVLTLAVGLAVAPALPADEVTGHELLKLAFAGMLLGLLARLVWETTLVAAGLLDVVLGRGSIGVQGLTESDSNGPFTSLAGLMYLSIFFASGFHLVAIEQLATVAAFTASHIGRGDPAGGLQSLVWDGLRMFSRMFRAAVSVSLPALLVALLVDLTLGWANRTLRSLPAMFLAMPLRAMLGWLLVPSTLLAAGAVLIDVLSGAT